MTWALPLGLLGLLAVPAVLVLHLFRRRLQQRRVAGLFLWTGERLVAAAGRKRTRLLQSWPLWLEMLAAAVAALWLAGPTFGGRTARHLVAVLDDSASMAAVVSGSAAQQRVLEQLAQEVRRLSPGDRLTVVQSGPRPKVALGPAAPPGEFDRATLPYRPAQPDHDLGPALDLAAELAGTDGEVWLGTDRPWPGCADTVTLCAVGRPAPNAALLSCRRWSQPGSVRVSVSIAGHGGIGSTTLRVLAAGRPLLRRQVEILREPVAVTFDLPADSGELELELGDDALLLDNRAWLLPPPRRVVGICDALPAPLRQGLQIGRVLAALPDWRSQPDPQQAQLRLSTAPGRLSGGQIELVFRGDAAAERDAWPGPFLFDSGSALLDGVRLQGVVWVAARRPPAEQLPGRMLIAAGRRTLCSEQEEALGRRVWFDLDPDVGNVVRAPDWPILMANLLEAARAEVPGPERQDLVLGQEARYRRSMLAGGGGQLQLLAPDGQRSPGRGVRTLAWLPLQAGRHSVRDAEDREVAAFAVQFVDPAESDLAAAATATAAATQRLAGHRGAAVDGAFERRLLALLLLLLIVADWCVLQRRAV